jgi:hypothetical protein
VAALITAGCVGGNQNIADTPTPQIVYVTVLVTPIPETTPVISVTSSMPVPVNVTSNPTTQISSDPILHRWIRQYRDKNTGWLYGYEYRFYPGGTLNYREGYTKMVSSNIMIDNVTFMASGTWTAIGSNKYIVSYLPIGGTGAQVIHEYTLVPAHEDPSYPGVVFPSHIESEFEKNQINILLPATLERMYYPEQAKKD